MEDDEIDKINTEIKAEEDTVNKVLLALEIGKVVAIIRGLDELKSGNYFDDFQCLRKKDYIWFSQTSK